MCAYKLALLLYKLIQIEIPKLDWVDINFQQSYTSRNNKFEFFGTNIYRVGCYNIYNRLNTLTWKLELNSVILSFDSFK